MAAGEELCNGLVTVSGAGSVGEWDDRVSQQSSGGPKNLSYNKIELHFGSIHLPIP
jgi:hypothetical protein